MVNEIISTILQYWYIWLGLFAIGAGILMNIKSNPFYKRGYKGARDLVIIDRINIPMTVFSEWENQIKRLQEKIYETALSTDHSQIKYQIDMIESKIEGIKNDLSKLNLDRESITRQDVSDDTDALDDRYYSNQAKEIKSSAETINFEIESLEKQLSTSTQERLSKVPSQNASSNKPHLMRVVSKIVDNISSHSQILSTVWFFFALLVLDYILATYFFRDIALDQYDILSKIAIGWFVPLGVTLLAMWMMHLFFTNLRITSERSLDTRSVLNVLAPFMGALIIIGPLVVYRIGLVVSNGGGIFGVGLELILSILFTFFVILVAHGTAMQNLHKEGTTEMSDFMKSPILLVFNLVVVLVMWPLAILEVIAKGIYNFAINIFRDDRSEAEIQFQKKISNLKKELEDKSEELISNRKEQEAARSGQISQKAKEYLESKKNKLDDIEKTTVEKNALLSKDEKELDIKNNNITDLRRGSDDGVISGLKTRIKREKK